ncbi:hypothetical protein ACOSQ2_016820 [Xanthoceras sorbifolium]
MLEESLLRFVQWIKALILAMGGFKVDRYPKNNRNKPGVPKGGDEKEHDEEINAGETGLVVNGKGALEVSESALAVNFRDQSAIQFRNIVKDRDKVSSPKVRRWKRLARGRNGTSGGEGT